MIKIIKFLIPIFLIIVVTGCFSGQVSTMEKTIENQSGTTGETQQKVAEESKEKSIRLGEPMTINELKFKVDSVTGYKKLGTSMFGKETKGEFYKICLTLENLGKTSTYLYDTAMIEPQFILVDNQGRQYDSNYEYEMYIADAINMMEQLQPGLPLEGCKIFELPANAEGLQFLISKGWLTNDAIAVMIQDSEIKHLEAETSMQDQMDQQMNEAMTESQKQMDGLMEN